MVKEGLDDSITDKLEILSSLYGFSVNYSDTGIKIDFNGFVGLQFLIDIHDDNVDFRFWVRTSSWYYIDERTDIHDLINLLFSVYLKSNKISSSTIINVPNEFGISESEIYSSFSITSQSNYSFQKSNKFIHSLIDSALFFQSWLVESFGCPCEECNLSDKLRIGETVDISKAFKSNIYSAIGKSSNVNYKKRFYPSWEYFRDFDKSITIVKGNKITEFVYTLSEENEGYIVKSINGQLIKIDNLHNYISYSTIRRAKKILWTLNNNKKIDIRFIVLDNVVIFSTPIFFISINGRYGIFEYKKEKEKLRERHIREFELLFSPTNLKWNEQIKPDRFENLIKDLLDRDSTVQWVRKFAHTNEPDGGRDLICRKSIPNLTTDENAPTTKTIEIIVQCKQYKNGVGKDKVHDIRDTVEHNNYGGYLLVVSSYTKKSLTEHLDVLRKKGTLWIDWWTQDEIFDRIKLHPDLINKYSDLLIVTV
jgi:hypothetical protein